MGIMKRGDTWYVRMKIEGRDTWRAAGSKENAEVMLGRMRDNADRGRAGRTKRSTLTLDQWIPDFLRWAEAHKKSWKRDKLSLSVLSPKLGHFKLTDIDKGKVEGYQRDRRKQVSNATVNREIAALRKALNHAVEMGQIEEHHLHKVKMLPEAEPRVPVLSVEDEARLLALAAERSPWFVPFLRLALATGARAGELTALRWRHVDFDEGEIVIEQSKGGAPRRVPVSRAVLAELKELKRKAERGDAEAPEAGGTVEDLERRRQVPEKPVFNLPTGKALGVFTVSAAFKRLARAIDKGELRLHDVRHVAATRFLGQGKASLPEVATLLGQKTLIMARRYAHSTKARLRSIVEDAAVPASPVDEAAKGEGKE